MSQEIKHQPLWLQMLGSHHDAVIVTDAEGNITALNLAAHTLTGWTELDAIDRNIGEVFCLIDPTTREPLDDPVWTARAIKSENPSTRLLIASDGTHKSIDYQTVAISESSGGVYRIVVIFREKVPTAETDELLQLISQWAAEMIGGFSSDIFLYDSESDALRLVIGHGHSLNLVGRTLKPGEGLTGRVFASGRPMIIPDYHQWEGKAKGFARVLPEYTCGIGVPLLVGGRVTGVLGANCDSRMVSLHDNDIRSLSFFANLAAICLENAQMHQEVRERMRTITQILEQQVVDRTADLAHRVLQLETSAKVSKQVSSILQINDLLTSIVTQVRDAFGFYCVQVYLLEGKADQLVLRARSTISDNDKPIPRVLMKVDDQSLNSTAVRETRTLAVDNASQDPRFMVDPSLPETSSELVVPLRVGSRIIGTLDVQSTDTSVRRGDVLVIESLADQVAIAIENARLYELARERATLRERNRLAHELHDSVTQSLWGLHLHAKAAQTYLEKDSEKAKSQIHRIRVVTQDTIQQMRSLIFDLRPADAPEDIGIVLALERQIEILQRSEGAAINLEVENARRLSADTERGIYRITLEAIRNAIKHASAQEISVKVAMHPDKVSVVVTDDGQGFDPRLAPADSRAFGLIGMEERAKLLDAKLRIDSGTLAGTRVRLDVPI